MAGHSPADALEAFLKPLRESLQCVADAGVVGSSATVGKPAIITLDPRGGEPGNVVPLRMSSGHRDLRRAVYHGYEVVHTAESRAPYNVQSQRYAYEILDREGREILVFHWHPHGAGNVSTPRLHISGMRPIALPNRPDGTIPAPLDVSNAHLPTGRIVLEDVIGMLIRDIGVAPLEPAWESVLATNRGSIENR